MGKAFRILTCLAVCALACSCHNEFKDFFPLSGKFVELGKTYQIQPSATAVLYGDDGGVFVLADVFSYSGWNPKNHEQKLVLVEIDTANIKSISDASCLITDNAKSFNPTDLDARLDEQFLKELREKKGYAPTDRDGLYFLVAANGQNYNFAKKTSVTLRSGREAWAYPLLILTPVTLAVDSPYALAVGGFRLVYFGMLCYSCSQVSW